MHKSVECTISYFSVLPPRTLDEITKEEFSRVLDVNVLGAFLVSKVIYHELLIDPFPPRGNFVDYDFLKLRYIRNKMTHVGHLAVGALPCDSHVNYVTLKHLSILLFKYKLYIIFIHPHADCLKTLH